MPDPDSSTPVLPKQNPRRRGFAIVGALLIFGGIFVAAWLGQGGGNWLLIALGLAAFVALLGWHITGRIGGILINERNLMSLSRFQLTIWTIIILSGFFLIAVGRIRAGSDDPLAIAMDWHLWALMGISTASLIGSPLILNSKKDQQPAPEVMKKAAVILKEPQAEIEKNREGLLYSNTDIGDATFADMFQGDEVQNTYYLDLAKVQMFIFTIIAATAYSAALWNLFDQAKGAPGGLEMMPGVSDGIIALLGISHLGFLSSKGVAHTKTQ